ncbi:glycoside hydrolase family 16 protein [Ascoidea rubescens DSM 1968]|uniref:Glycoside hydrolase family 16 protein n=1 Tax=Ascoidea rubescens DSM 1968 TaxID=1344418 RepID=A0A1D2VDU4_9ASCO|nr:glycoside hydrolase family 16 protein [Ascoidea rubescens DSM 1968]ODV59663.1 glycoside hydrolase family 16 protein [Ascoidea rubescens DSM 1968]
MEAGLFFPARYLSLFSLLFVNILNFIFFAYSLEHQICDPTFESCPDTNVPLGTTVLNDFTKIPILEPNFSIWSPRGSFTFSSQDGLKISLHKQKDNPSIRSNFYIMYGKIEVILKTAIGQGIVSCLMFLSDSKDEIDLEWLGGSNFRDQIQSNFFIQGKNSIGLNHFADNHSNIYHNYTLDWTEDVLTWYIDGKEFRSLYKSISNGYPQSPMAVLLGLWAGGDPDNPQGTINWAGGLTDYNQGPFSMFIKNIIVTDYSSGSIYRYSDNTGKNIKAINGNIYRRYEKANDEFNELHLVNLSSKNITKYLPSEDSDNKNLDSNYHQNIDKEINQKDSHDGDGDGDGEYDDEYDNEYDDEYDVEYDDEAEYEDNTLDQMYFTAN